MKICIATVVMAFGAVVGAPVLAASGVIDLDAPGSLARLHDEQPDRYATVRSILHDAARLPPRRAEGWIRTTYAVDDVSLGRLLLVSYPAKRRLTFSIGDASYAATVTIDGDAVAVPLR